MLFGRQKLPDNGTLDAKLENLSLQLKNFGDTIDLKLKSTTENICNEVNCVKEKVEETRVSLDNHVDWHNNLYMSITKGTFKVIGCTVAVVCVIALVLGFKDGILLEILTKMVG